MVHGEDACLDNVVTILNTSIRAGRASRRQETMRYLPHSLLPEVARIKIFLI